MPAPDGDVDGALWLLGDFVSGLAVTSTLAAGERITTLRLTLHVVARDEVHGTLHAVGCLDERNPEVALSTAVITDDDGRTLARAHGRNAVLRDEQAAEYRTATPDVVAHRAGAPTRWWARAPAPDPDAVNPRRRGAGRRAGLPALLRALADGPRRAARTRRRRRSCAPSPPTGAPCAPRSRSSTTGAACAAGARCCATTGTAPC